MKAKYLKNESLPKGETWQLENGWKAHKSFTWQGIAFVSKLISPNGKQFSAKLPCRILRNRLLAK